MKQRTPAQQRWKCQIKGIVQGVGFRPTVFGLAEKYQLSGWVLNSSNGVTLEVQGLVGSLGDFWNELLESPPPLARIYAATKKVVAVKKNQKPGLQIKKSQAEDGWTFISPDVAMCADCRDEMLDPSDRRFEYPFINCTNCGPRFTITKELPYDRPSTTMSAFAMCEQCQREYSDPADRRYHAQPIACPECGPKIWWEDTSGEKSNAEALVACVEKLRAGGIVAIKGLGGFHLCCDATNQKAVEELRTRKHRPQKAFAVMVNDISQLKNVVECSEFELNTLEQNTAPIVILKKLQGGADWVEEVSPNNSSLGVMVPYTPLHTLLLQKVGVPLVMTSGNQSGFPLCIDDQQARDTLSQICDGFVFHDRAIHRRCDDSVVTSVGKQVNKMMPVRRSRGFVPEPVLLPEGYCFDTPVLAAGSDLKNTVALGIENVMFCSQHIGDLENVRVRETFSEIVNDLQQVFSSPVEVVVTDLHPNFISTKSVTNQLPNVQQHQVQHHHAHLASCLVDNSYSGEAIGLIFDGTGYGEDGTIWGGEVLVGSLAEYSRVFHLQQLPLPGGDSGVKRPDRIAYSYLKTLAGDFDHSEILSSLDSKEIKFLDKMLKKDLHITQTSSIGRLFDVVSAVLGICTQVTYEGEAAIALEDVATQFEGKKERLYSCTIAEGKIQLEAFFAELIIDVQNDVPVAEIAYVFHATIAEMCVQVVSAIQSKRKHRLPVALSGGVWQNRLLRELVISRLESKGNQVLTHSQIPCNDGGISIGQLAVFAAQQRNN